jgi:quinol monooxygenase YgiN
MLIQSIHYTFGTADGDRAAALLVELQDLSRREHGVLAFEVARGSDRPNIFALWEVYRDQAALESHVASEHFTRLVVGGLRKLAIEREGWLGSPLAPAAGLATHSDVEDRA